MILHLVLWEEFEPLLEELIQVICHIIIGGGKLVAEGETLENNHVQSIDQQSYPPPAPTGLSM